MGKGRGILRERYPYPNPYRMPPCQYGEPEDAGLGLWMPESVWDREEKRDLEYWEQLYPAKTRRLQREVTRQCDMVDHNGSFIYDEYPDRIALARLCEAVYQAYRAEEDNNLMGEYPLGMPQQEDNGEERNLIEALVYNELHRRRRARRRRRVSVPLWR